MAKIVILQEYIPRYREAFFDGLGAVLLQQGHSLVLGIGAPSKALKARGDASSLSEVEVQQLRSRHIVIAGRRINLRLTAPVVREADFLVIEHARRNIDVYRLLFPRALRRTPTALWGHGRDYVKSASWAENTLMKLLARRADWYFVYTAGGRDHLVHKYGLQPDIVTVVQNSLDSAQLRDACFSVTDEQVARFKRSVGAVGPVILFLGAIDPSKKIDFLIASVHRARKILSDATLVIAGDGVLREQVQEAARAHSWIRWIGTVTGEDKAVALRAASVLAIPGRVGLVAVDSFSARRPIVTTNHQHHAPEYEYLTDRVNCLVAEDTQHGFADALVTALTDETLLSSLRASCDRSYDQFSLEAMINNFATGIAAWSSQHEGRR